MLGDESANPDWNVELVEMRRVPNPRRYDPLASARAVATSAGSCLSKDLLEPEDGDTEGNAKSVHLGSRSYWGKCSDFVSAFDFDTDNTAESLL